MTFPMDLDDYRHMKRSDPTYTAKDAYRDWFSEHPEEAEEMVRDCDPDFDVDVFRTWDDVEDYISDLRSIDAFNLGRFSDVSGDGPWHLDGYGNIEPFDLDEAIQDKICDLWHAVYCGEQDVDEELAEILGLWGIEASYNVRPVKKPVKRTSMPSKARSVAKKPVSKTKKPVKRVSVPSKTKKPVKSKATAKRTNVSRSARGGRR